LISFSKGECAKGVFENRLLRMIFDSKTEEVAEGWGKLYNEHHNLFSSPIIYMVLNQEGLNARCLSKAWERNCIQTGFWLGSLKGGGNLEDLDVNVRTCAGFMWFRIRKSGCFS